MLSGRIVVGSDNWDQLAMLEQIVRALAAYKDFLTVWNDDHRDPERSQSRVREGAIARRSPTSSLAACDTLRNQAFTVIDRVVSAMACLSLSVKFESTPGEPC
jgi:hypothetical protein